MTMPNDTTASAASAVLASAAGSLGLQASMGVSAEVAIYAVAAGLCGSALGMLFQKAVTGARAAAMTFLLGIGSAFAGVAAVAHWNLTALEGNVVSLAVGLLGYYVLAAGLPRIEGLVNSAAERAKQRIEGQEK